MFCPRSIIQIQIIFFPLYSSVALLPKVTVDILAKLLNRCPKAALCSPRTSSPITQRSVLDSCSVYCFSRRERSRETKATCAVALSAFSREISPSNSLWIRLCGLTRGWLPRDTVPFFRCALHFWVLFTT